MLSIVKGLALLPLCAMMTLGVNGLQEGWLLFHVQRPPSFVFINSVELIDINCRLRGTMVHFSPQHYVLYDQGTCPSQGYHTVEIWLAPTRMRVVGLKGRGMFR